MRHFVSLTHRSTWIALLWCLDLSKAAAQAQDKPEPAPSAEPAPPAIEPRVSPPPTASETAAQIAALREELDALKAKQEEAEASALLAQPSETADNTAELLRVYGFTDFGIDKYFLSGRDAISVLRPTSASTFVFGNLNLYFDAHPIEHLRTMVEVRFTLAPHGEETELGPPLGTSYQRVDTTAFDFSAPSSQDQLRLGGLYIERAWSEYQFSDLFKVQWGLFLNPFGIWNLDHGSPTLISLMLPEFVASKMIPTRLLGVHLYGSAFFGSTEIGYAVHVTNGRTPLDFDLSEDKALGWRLYLAHEGDLGRLVLGTSGYWGTYLDQQRQYEPNASNFVALTNTVDYTEEAVGVDLAVDVGGLRVRTEAVLRWIDYRDGKSERTVTTAGTFGYLPNRLEYAGYVLAAYRTPWRIEPYVEAEISSRSNVIPRWAGTGVFGTANVAALFLSAGFNVELTTHTLFKTQLVWDRAWNRHFKDKLTDSPILFVRVVDSF
jgi:hypothetical protein